MKLIDKKTIGEQKSKERKKEVEEGMKLAKSVDSLRETHAKEQTSLKKFRDESLKAIKSELDELRKIKELLEKEVIDLEERKKLALSPVDLTSEWKQIEKDKQELLQRETTLISREVLVQELDKREEKINEKEQEAETYLEGARESYTKTENLRQEMEDKKNKFEAIISENIFSLSVKEKDLMERESVVAQQKEYFTKERNDLLTLGTNLIERESKVDSENKSLIEREEKIKEQEALTQRYVEEASINYDRSESVKTETENLKKQALQDIHNRYVQLAEREREVGYRERDLALERETIENDKKEIEKEKTHIASQQQTLKVAWENIKKLKK